MATATLLPLEARLLGQARLLLGSRSIGDEYEFTDWLLEEAAKRLAEPVEPQLLLSVEDELNVAACDDYPVGYYDELTYDERVKVLDTVLSRYLAI